MNLTSRNSQRGRLSGLSPSSLRRLLTSRGRRADCNQAQGTTSHPSPPSIRSTRTISRRYLLRLSHAPLTRPLARIESKSCQLALGQECQYLASIGQLLKLRPHLSKTRTCLRARMKILCPAQVLITTHRRATSSLRPNHNVFNSSVPQSNASPKATNSSKMMRLGQVHTPFPSQLSRPSRSSLGSARESQFASSRDKTGLDMAHAVPRTKTSTW